MTQSERNLVVFGAWLASALVAIAAFFDAGAAYRYFRLSFGLGTTNIHISEINFYVWYALFGGLAALFLALAVARTALTEALARLLLLLFSSRWFLPAAMLLLVGEIVLFQRLVLELAPIADDEATYVFIARTLLGGHLVNPPPGDPEFFANQFVISNGSGWYGKYPIGHPLLLAAGEALGCRRLVVPAVTAGVLAATYFAGRKLFGRNQAALAVAFLLLSPQFVLTGATELSQPASALFEMLALCFLLRAEDRGDLASAALSGACLGAGILVRPLPGVLLVPVAALALLVRAAAPVRRRALEALALVAPVALAAAVLFAVNAIQTGDPARSGYHVAHAGGSGLTGLGIFQTSPGVISTSLGGALLRQSFWLFGWPLGLAAVAFARPKRSSLALFGFIAAVYAYRIIVPKTVVATTGPIYVYEAVPLLALACANGVVGLARRFAESPSPAARRLIPALTVAGFAVAAVTFVPTELGEIGRSSTLWRSAYVLLDQAHAGRALVFGDAMLDRRSDVTWAYCPPNPSPTLDDEVVFLRAPKDRAAAARAVELWHGRFAGRTAWQLLTSRSGVALQPILGPDDFRLGPETSAEPSPAGQGPM